MEKEVDETGKKVAIEVLKSVAKNDPLIRTALSAYECINTIEKIDHYAEIADEKGAASAAGEFVKDTAKQVVKDYSTDVVTDTIVNSGVINSNQREQVQRVVGMVVDYGVDKAEEAFLNE